MIINDFKFKFRLQRNKFLFTFANIFYKKAFYLAHTPPICAKKMPFFTFNLLYINLFVHT